MSDNKTIQVKLPEIEGFEPLKVGDLTLTYAEVSRDYETLDGGKIGRA